MLRVNCAVLPNSDGEDAESNPEPHSAGRHVKSPVRECWGRYGSSPMESGGRHERHGRQNHLSKWPQSSGSSLCSQSEFSTLPTALGRLNL